METADQGFDDLSRSLDNYLESVKDDSAKGDLDIEINSISLHGFMEKWAEENKFRLREPESREAVPSRLIRELEEYGITSLAELNEIIPANYVQKVSANSPVSTMLGTIRTWMILHDPDKVVTKVTHSWSLGATVKAVLEQFFDRGKVEEIAKAVAESRIQRQ
ncbi:hypothetical protein P6U16_09860 [Rhizobium sp. 32-5/1]|uniref:hypothetical protein n=1 Tax=Rhizobium sp. 32-5/1 TaxID=3019602 RepID=UPI00240E6E71|nr:hypothetical protein [Rhizobium sp. 32-5/1]WEZ84812.1 hypothetical protein P6U16_09860 [Rhizobium sp. 32-5/1]